MDPLPKVYDELREEAEDRLAEVAYGPPAADAARAYEALVDAFHGLAIGSLLLDYDPDRFRARLVHAAGARRQFYQVCLRDDAEMFHRALSRTDALFCAVASRHTPAARELVHLAPGEWVPDGEYEDDFCYHALIAREVAPDEAAGLPEARALLDRFETALAGGTSVRLDVCHALADNDASAFASAFGDLLTEREAWAEDLYPSRSNQPLFLMARYVFVEGLALLAIAEARGWPMPDRYAFCPEIGRLSPPSSAPDDLMADLVPILREQRRARGLPS